MKKGLSSQYSSHHQHIAKIKYAVVGTDTKQKHTVYIYVF